MLQHAQLANHEESTTDASSDVHVPPSVLQIADLNLKCALIAYLTTPALACDIARQHGFSASVLSFWARKLGLPLRRRGRRRLAAPSLQHRRILTLVQHYGMAATARRIGRTRQYVQQIVARWAPGLRPVRAVPPVSYRRCREGHQPRDYIVCFRVSEQEIKDLANAEILDMPRGLSAHEIAREVVLRFLDVKRQPPHPFTPPVTAVTDLKKAA